MASKSKMLRPLREDHERALRSMGIAIDLDVDDLMILGEAGHPWGSPRQQE